jgi:PAS domain S-box-containing protein
MQLNQEVLESIIQSAFECVVVVDKEGKVILMSDPYCEFLGVQRETVIGKPVQEVIENTRMHLIVQTGHMELADLQKINGNSMIANRIPLKQNGQIIGAVGTVIFRNMKELDTLKDKIQRLTMEVEYYRGQLQRESSAKYWFDHIAGNSPIFRDVKALAQKVAKSHSTVLITGESGTGKELFAHAIHHASLRSDKPFIKINCAAIPENLLESELFGYADGAFTGAKKGGKPGKFELANGGSLFLDEIGEMPLNMQTKLLRVLQEMEVERIGAQKTIPIDVRIIAATNTMLEEAIARGDFRKDLYYRLHIIRLEIPALRERKEDIPLLTEKLIAKLNFELGQMVTQLSDEAMHILLQHQWPGNIRELENVLERAMNVVEYSTIEKEHLPYYLKKKTTHTIPEGKLSLKEILEAVEKDTIRRALQLCGDKRYDAASLLGISKTTLYDKIKRYQLD